MAGFLYFLPGKQRTITIEDLWAAGVGYAFDKEFTAAEVTRGPSSEDCPGVCVSPPSFKQNTGYYKNRQTWSKIPGLDVWVGFFNESKPTPDNLEKRRMLDGHYVELGDGNDWLCPIARGMDTSTGGTPNWYNALPSTVTINDDGNWHQSEIVAEYGELWKIACNWFDSMILGAEGTEENDPIKFNFEGAFDAALLALATNYRVGKAEVSILKLFETDAPSKILGALVDWPTMQDWFSSDQKKTESETRDG